MARVTGMSREAGAEGDVFHCGALFYKTGTWTSSQQYTAQLKFESASGPKRIDFYHLQSNRALSGRPLATVPLTHVLGVNTTRQHGLSRIKNAFQILTTTGKFQFGTRSPQDRDKWTSKLDEILHHLSLCDRTHEFNVSVFPTAHSDKLRLNGQYMLKISMTEIYLFSANGTIPSQFWTPLGSVRKVHHCVIPASGTAIAAQLHGGGGAYGSSRTPTTHALLIITTEKMAPIGEGGFAFSTESAKDIADIVTQRRERRLQLRSAAVSPPSSTNNAGEEASRDASPTTKSTRVPNLPRKKKLSAMKSLPSTSSTEEKENPPSGTKQRTKTQGSRSVFEASDDSVNAKALKQHEQASVRMCARKARIIPKSHLLQKAKTQFHLNLGNGDSESGAGTLFTPEEQNYITNTELGHHQQKFHEWKQKMKHGEDESGRESQESSLSEAGREKRQGWVQGRSFTITSPIRENDYVIADRPSLDSEYVYITRGEASRNGSMTGLQRQRNINALSPMEGKEFLGIRPRANAFSEASSFSERSKSTLGLQNPFPSPTTKPQLHKQVSAGAEREEGGESLEPQVWQCNDETCFLVPRPHKLASIQQKSSSDPELSLQKDLELSIAHEYLTILPPESRKKPCKKPIPTPRTFKPQLPQSLPLNENSIHTTPPTPCEPECSSSDERCDLPNFQSGLELLLSSQRSLSESNLYSSVRGTGEDVEEDDYVDMSQFCFGEEICMNSNEFQPEFDTLALTPREVETPIRARFQRQRSGSMGAFPKISSQQGPHTYENVGNCLAPPPQDVATSLRGGLQRQRSSSTGDLAKLSIQGVHMYENSRNCLSNFLETEEIYENGEHCMEYYLYGETSSNYDDATNKSDHRGNTVPTTSGFGSYGDSGLGSTPNCSPLLIHRSFSLDDMRLGGTAELTEQREEEEDNQLYEGATGQPALHVPDRQPPGSHNYPARYSDCIGGRGQGVSNGTAFNQTTKTSLS